MISVLVAEDNVSFRKVLREALLRDGFEVEEAGDGREALEMLGRRHYDLLVSDVKMPGADGLELLRSARQADPDTVVILMTAYGTVDMAVEAMKAGALDFLSKPFPVEEFMLTVARAAERNRLLRENQSLKQSLSLHYDAAGIVWKSRAMAGVMDLVRKVAQTPSTVLVTGESGTGKELIAHAVHAQSVRNARAMVKVSIPVLSEGVLESELFGHEKGSFTGALTRKPGRFELADGGTIFLDEIGDLTPAVQVKLLRVLQEREFERVGGTVPLKVDVRLIAATRHNLRDMVKAGKFREDLYFRLNVVNIEVPPLRDRKDDIPPLVDHFLAKYGSSGRVQARSVNPESMELLQAYSWPGNVRELENVIQRALVLAEGESITPFDLPADVTGGASGMGMAPAGGRQAGEDAEKEGILEALKLEKGNRSRAAARLGLRRTTFLYKMKKHGLI
jgi:DNA-binding NtrC family response regulator